MYEEDFPEDELEEVGDQSDDRSLRDIDEDWKRLKENYKKVRGRGAEEGAGKGAAKGAGEKGVGKKGAEKAAAKGAGKKGAEKAAAKGTAKVATKLAAKAAIGAATEGAGLILLIPDLISLLKSKWGKRILGLIACCTCGPSLIIIGGILMFLVVVVGGQMGDANNNCPDGDIEDWSYQLVKDNKECYRTALENAEKITNVPKAILAAIDYREHAHGFQDGRGQDHERVLVEIGKEVQRTNQARDKNTGELLLDEEGMPMNTVSAGAATEDNPNVFGAIAIMSNYRCERLATDLATERAKSEPSINPQDKNQMAQIIDEFCHKGKTGTGNSIYNTVEDEWMTDKFVHNSIADEIKGTISGIGRGIPFIGHITTAAGTVASWGIDAASGIISLPSKVWDTVTCNIPGSSCNKPSIGAATWLKIYLAGPELRKEHLAEDSGTSEDIEGCNLKEWKTGGSRGLPPDCNKPGLSGGEKALCAAEQAAVLQKPYIWGGPDECRDDGAACPPLEQISGFDCSGLTSWAWYQAIGKNIGGDTGSQLANISNHPAINDLQPGDLVFYPGHVAIYKGDGKVIHAPLEGMPVQEADMGSAGSGGIIGTARPE